MTVFTPRSYQMPTTNYILDTPRCGVWGFLGCGKTAATLSALDILNLVEPGPTLVIAPLRVARSTWSDEVAKWENFAHLCVSTIVGNPDERAAALRKKADIYTVNFENIPWLVKRLKNNWPFQKVVFDEATKLRAFRISEEVSSAGKTFLRAAGGMRFRDFGKLSHVKINRFIELTAEPAPNGLKDLWAQGWFLDKGYRLGRNYTAYVQRWFEKSYNEYGVTPKEHAHKEITGLLKDVCMSLNAKDYFDVKDPIVTPVFVDLPVNARIKYREMEKKFFTKIKERPVEAVNSGVKTGKLRQLASGAVYLNPDADNDADLRSKEWAEVHNEKIEAVRSVIEEANGMPVIVVYDFRSDLTRLQKAFPKARVLKTKKDEDDFKAGKIGVLLMHFKSAAHGIDGFQYATHIMAILSPDWNLEDYNQGVGRINPVRQLQAGFERPTLIYPIVARNTIDEVIVFERWPGKRSVQDLILEAMRKVL
jgi:SNF2 family DNA or RNA helicase